MKKAAIILIFICTSFITYSQITIFQDDFEYYTPRKFPSLYWNPWHNCSSQPTYNFVSNLISDTSNVLQVYGAHDNGCWPATAALLLNTLPQKIRLEADLMASGEAGTGGCGRSDIGLALLHQRQASSGYDFIDIRFGDDLNIHLDMKGERTNTLQPFNINQWYNVRFELNTIDTTLTAWIDDVAYGPYLWSPSNLPYPLSEYTAVAITSDDGKGWGDNLKIYDTTIPVRIGLSAPGKLLVYPNPVREKLTIESNFNRKSILHIFNAAGQIIYREEMNTKKVTVNTSNLQDGLYYLVIKDRKGTTLHAEKILKE